MRYIPDWFIGGDSRRRNEEQPSTARQRHRTLSIERLETRALMTASVTPVYAVTNAWNSGFQADLRLESHQAASISAWRLEFDMAANITSIWNAKVVSHTGNHYTVVGETWDSTLPANGSVDFGFVASGAASAKPTNYRLNGDPLGGTTPTPPTLPTISIGDVTQAEGANGTTSAVFTVGLSAPSATSVTVKYATADGTAHAGPDYRAASGTLTFAPGETTKSINVVLLGDLQVEPDEAFFVELSTPVGATFARPRAAGTIENDDAPPTPSGDFQFQVGSDWGSGFTGQLMIRNSGSVAIDNWQLEFDFAGAITSIWDAKIVSHVGNHYVVQNAGYNSAIAAGGSLSFGFNGSPGHVTLGPTNYVLRGDGTTTPGGGGPTGGNHAPVAAADLAFTSPGQAVTINALANDTDPDGDALSIIAVAQASHGVVALQPDSTIKYTPLAGYSGGDSFTYQLRDARGATVTGAVSVNVAAVTAWPAQVYAPYVDMGLYPMYDLVKAAQTHGLRYFSLAFVVADPRGQPSWGGYTEYALGTAYDAQMKAQISGLRALGGDVVVSFGGAAGQELAQVITDVPALARAYQSVVDAYGLSHIDFDIEGAAVADRASVDRRNQAIAILQANAAAAGKTLHVSYTLPVLPTGLTPEGVYVVQSAVQKSVNVGLVNIMAMDYGDGAAPAPQGKMGDYAIAAANSLFAQLRGVYGTAKNDVQLWRMIGVTPMIGLNDVVSEVFDQQEARELLAFAQQKGLGRIAMWSLNRDRQSASGVLGWVDVESSSILQQPFEFSQIFRPFTA